MQKKKKEKKKGEKRKQKTNGYGKHRKKKRKTGGILILNYQQIPLPCQKSMKTTERKVKAESWTETRLNDCLCFKSSDTVAYTGLALIFIFLIQSLIIYRLHTYTITV